MGVGSARTRTGVSLSIARDPSLVRTVRLVAAAVVRRASEDEELVEEIRLAIGEACAVLVAGLSGAATDDAEGDRLQLEIDVDSGRLFVTVRSAGDGLLSAAPGAGDTMVDPWALLRGLSDDLVVETQDGRTALAMSWSL